MTLDQAIQEINTRVQAANATTQGADHQAIIEAVAGETGHEIDVLTAEYLTHDIAGAC